MSNEQTRRPTNEPDYVPSQAEGNDQPEPLTEHLRTPGKAEGEREAVEDRLDQPADQAHDGASDRSLWDRVKALFGMKEQ
jgi:hypothetical protein